MCSIGVVNPSDVTSALWTWTRGGWRGRYPEDLRRLPAVPERRNCVEYGLICALIAVAASVAFALGVGRGGMWTRS